jgi:hypothetical protein
MHSLSISPDSLNPSIQTCLFSDFLNDPLNSFTEANSQGRLDLPLPTHFAHPFELSDYYGDWASFSALADESIDKSQNITEARSSVNKDK